MSLLDVTGVVLNRRDVREDSRLYTIFTHERGKLEVFGRGIRKGKAKLGGHLEPGATVRVTLAQGKTGETITAVERDHYPVATMASLGHLASLGFTLSLVDAITKPDAPDPSLASFLQEAIGTLENLDGKPDDHARFRMWVAWHVLDRSGHSPELEHCVHCRKELLAADVHFSATLGGFLGPECMTADVSAKTVDGDVRTSIRQFVHSAWPELPAFPPERDVERTVADLTRLAMDHVLERRLPAERFVQFARALG
ncbi:MAG: DNA repair protein RecO [Patescibacteria group bacterium]